MEAVTLAARRYGFRVGILAVEWILMSLWVSQFRGESAFFAVFEYLPLLGMIALGLAVTLISGEFDLSVGSMAAVGGVIAVRSFDAGMPIALLAGVAVGAAIGACQGWAITKTGINSLAFTIGSLVLLRGLAYVLAGNSPLQIQNLSGTDIFLERWWVFSFDSLVAIGAFVIVGAFLAWSRWGRELYAIGGGRAEAKAMGIAHHRSVVIAFMVSGMCAALGGSLATMKGGTADPASYESVLLSAVAAVLLGGVSLYGGRGTVVNVLIGVAMLGVLSAGLNIRGELPAVTEIVTGTVLLVVIALFSAGAALSNWRKRFGQPSEPEVVPME